MIFIKITNCLQALTRRKKFITLFKKKKIGTLKWVHYDFL